jgi:drug/metabolite transporter (DMT)-like permease
VFLKEENKGILSLVLLAWIFATMGVFARYLSTDFELFEQTYLRIGLAFLLGCILFVHKIDVRKICAASKKDLLILAFRAVTLYLGVVLFTEAILSTAYGNASFVASLPLMPLLGYILLRETLKMRTLLYILLSFIGVALIAITDFSTMKIGYGEVVALLSLVSFDLSYIARRWHSDYLNNYESAVVIFGIGALFLFLTSMILGENLPTVDQFSLSIVAVLLIAAIFNVANLLLTNYGFAHVKVAVATNILTLEVVFALAYGIFLFKEIPVLREVLGGALILYSVYMVNRLESSNK